MSCPIDFRILGRCARDELVHELETASMGDRVDVLIEDSLLKPLDRIAGASLLREHGVDKIYRFEPSTAAPPWGQSSTRIYLIRPTPINAKYVADHTAADQRSSATASAKKYVILFWPVKLRSCELIFEQQGVYGRAVVNQFNPVFIPFDTDLLSLELPEYFNSSLVDGTNVWYKTVAQCLLRLRSVCNGFGDVHALGTGADRILNLFQLLSAHESTDLHPADSTFSHVFLFDRDLDYASVFLSCLTYEALIDDIFSIKCGFVDIPGDAGQQPTKLLLSNDTDAVYAAIRYKHFSCVMEELKWKVRELQGAYDKRHQMDKVTELKQFVTNDLRGLKQNHRLLAVHIGAGETIMAKKSKENFQEQLRHEHAILANLDYKESLSYVEDCAAQQSPDVSTLSLLCLLSLSQNGLGGKEYQALRRQVLQAYGHKHLSTLFQLKKMGIVFERGPAVATNFPSVCKRLNLCPDAEVDLKKPSHPSYVFNGAYTPALCEIVDRSLRSGFQKDELCRIFGRPASMLESGSAVPANVSPSPSVGRPLLTSARNGRQTVLVCFLGGVTYAEIAAMKLIAEKRQCRLVVATTHIINRKKFFQALSG